MSKAAGLLFAAMLFAAPAAVANAHEFPVKRIGPDLDNASCIGDFSMPRCAVESYLACFLQEKPELCTPLGLPAPEVRAPNPINWYVDYRIVAIQPVDALLFAELLGGNALDWLGVYEVRVLERECDVGKECGNAPFDRHSYYLKKKGEEWKLVGKATEVEYGFSCHQGGAESEFDDFPRSAFTDALCDFFIEERIMPWVHVEEWK